MSDNLVVSKALLICCSYVWLVEHDFSNLLESTHHKKDGLKHVRECEGLVPTLTMPGAQRRDAHFTIGVQIWIKPNFLVLRCQELHTRRFRGVLICDNDIENKEAALVDCVVGPLEHHVHPTHIVLIRHYPQVVHVARPHLWVPALEPTQGNELLAHSIHRLLRRSVLHLLGLPICKQLTIITITTLRCGPQRWPGIIVVNPVIIIDLWLLIKTLQIETLIFSNWLFFRRLYTGYFLRVRQPFFWGYWWPRHWCNIVEQLHQHGSCIGIHQAALLQVSQDFGWVALWVAFCHDPQKSSTAVHCTW
mmetsp:Transcript_40026/g.74161  ORF Transcript_40026/g.74161 Transcript_40026/m.74161 type:complete len:305 (+) Transcript_40026:314-1228(+)